LENQEENCEKIGKIRMKCEMIWTIWKISVLVIITPKEFSISFHYSNFISSVFFISFHNFLFYFPNHFTIQLNYLPYFPHHFTIQPTFLPYFSYLFTIFFCIFQILSLFNFRIRKKCRLNCEMIWKIRKKLKLNSDKIWKIKKKIVKR
jgi:hypothetical protein